MKSLTFVFTRRFKNSQNKHPAEICLWMCSKIEHARSTCRLNVPRLLSKHMAYVTHIVISQNRAFVLLQRPCAFWASMSNLIFCPFLLSGSTFDVQQVVNK